MFGPLPKAALYAALLAPGLAPAYVVAVAPNPLESAYWRFEEGPAFTPVNDAIPDPVKDSINQNHLDAFNAAAAPLYVQYSGTEPPATELKSGLPNNFHLDFARTPNASDDLFTLVENGQFGKGLAKNINNGIVAAGGGFTVEAAFNTTNTVDFQGIIAKEGRPGLGRGLGFIENLPTFAIKARRFDGNPLDFRDGRLQIEQWDGAGNLVDVVSDEPLNQDQWYYVAVVNDGANLSMYLDSNDGMGYQLQGTPVPVTGAIYQGADPNNPSWDNSWVVGRAQFGGNPADFFDGKLDEVRITNSALTPSQFLFAPPGIEGDYNNNGTVDAADYAAWRNAAATDTLPNDPTPGIVNGADYALWRANFGKTSGGGAALAVSVVPEPASAILILAALVVFGVKRSRLR